MAAISASQAIELADKHQRAGRTGEAETLLRQVLSEQPENVEALFRLGYLLRTAGRTDDAIQTLRRVIALQPMHLNACANLAASLHAAGQYDQALGFYRRALDQH